MSKPIKKIYNYIITRDGDVYIELFPKMSLKTIDLETINFKSEYDLLIYLLGKHNVRVPEEILKDLGIEISYYLNGKRRSIKPLYKDDYLDRMQVIKDASYLSLKFPALFKDLLRKYRFGKHHPKIVRKAIETKESIAICDDKCFELEKKLRENPNNYWLEFGIRQYKNVKGNIIFNFFNEVYTSASYREIRDSYFIIKPYKAFYLEKQKRISSLVKTSKT